jgi:hypothetical protein
MLLPTPPSSGLLERYLQDAAAATLPREKLETAPAELEAIFEVLAMTTALEVTGELPRVPTSLRESLRREGSRALLQIGALLAGDDAEGEERAEAVRLLGPYARDGLRALSGREPASPRRDDAVVLDHELVGLLHGRFDGLRLAEIAWRIRASAEARRALALLQRVASDADRGLARARLRLAAEGGSAMRDPGEGRRIAELVLAGHAVELFRFEDGMLAAYAASTVMIRLGGEQVSPHTSRPGYAEASLGPGASKLELEVGGVTTTLSF